MQYVGVRTMNSTDAQGRSRFHCFRPEKHVVGGFPAWYQKYDAHGAKHVRAVTITKQYIKGFAMILL